MIKKALALLAAGILFTGCGSVNSVDSTETLPYSPVSAYNTEATAEITQVNYRWSPAGYNHRTELSVYCKEYDLSATREYVAADALHTKNKHVGETIPVTIRTIEKDGIVIDRYIINVNIHGE